MTNPFLVDAHLRLPLPLERCQELAFEARRTTFGQPCRHFAQSDTGIGHDWERELYSGDRLFANPLELQTVFAGVTTAVYDTIAALYCARLSRSPHLIWEIQQAYAKQAGAPPISYGAVALICGSLHDPHRYATQVTVRYAEVPWHIVEIVPRINLSRNGQPLRNPAVVCVCDASLGQVLAFRVEERGTLSDTVGLTLFEAICAGRRPAKDGVGGLVWNLPPLIRTEIDLSQRSAATCAKLGVRIEPASASSALLTALRGEWTRDLRATVVDTTRFATFLNTYLARIHGYGPLRQRKLQDQTYRRSRSYRSDPDWHFPALRDLLPGRTSHISATGDIASDGLHYADALLELWPGRPVSIQRSAQHAACAWVYFEEELVCQAMAREYRRATGTYRLARTER